MGDVVQLNQLGILAHAVASVPSQIILYDTRKGGIRWYNPAAERALKRLSDGLPMHLHDVMHVEEADAWVLEGQLVLKSGQIMEYVEHIAYIEEGLVSSRSGAWEGVTSKQLAYVQVNPASTRKKLVMRITLPMDRMLQLAEEYMAGTTDEGPATLTGR